MRTFVDLFCGIGGFRRALQQSEPSLECAFSCDIDRNAQEAYFQNFGERPFGDITTIDEKKDIPPHDILCAGFPCQPFSISGKMSGFNVSNGRLFYEIIRIVKYHRPYVMLLENVKNIVNIDNGEAIKTIEQALDENGYKVDYKVLNASYFGVPQARERVYFVCIRKDVWYATRGTTDRFKYKPPKATNKRIFLEDILETNVDSRLFVKDRSDIILTAL